MADIVAWSSLIGATAGLAQSYTNHKANLASISNVASTGIKKIELDAANYKASLEAITFTRSKNRELASNAVKEVLRASAANIREAKVAITQEEGRISARSEGITAGVSAARQLSTFYVGASKAIGQAQEETTRQLVGIADRLDESDAALAETDRQNLNRMIYNMQVGISTPLAQPSDLLAGFKGASIGTSIGKNLQDLFATNTEDKTVGFKDTSGNFIGP